MSSPIYFKLYSYISVWKFGSKFNSFIFKFFNPSWLFFSIFSSLSVVFASSLLTIVIVYVFVAPFSAVTTTFAFVCLLVSVFTPVPVILAFELWACA